MKTSVLIFFLFHGRAQDAPTSGLVAYYKVDGDWMDSVNGYDCVAPRLERIDGIGRRRPRFLVAPSHGRRARSP